MKISLCEIKSPTPRNTSLKDLNDVTAKGIKGVVGSYDPSCNLSLLSPVPPFPCSFYLTPWI